jgi:hypothetical protein
MKRRLPLPLLLPLLLMVAAGCTDNGTAVGALLPRTPVHPGPDGGPAAVGCYSDIDFGKPPATVRVIWWTWQTASESRVAAVAVELIRHGKNQQLQAEPPTVTVDPYGGRKLDLATVVIDCFVGGNATVENDGGRRRTSLDRAYPFQTIELDTRPVVLFGDGRCSVDGLAGTPCVVNPLSGATASP